MLNNNKSFKKYNPNQVKEWALPTTRGKKVTQLRNVERANRYLNYLYNTLSTYWMKKKYHSFWTLAIIVVRRSVSLRLLYIVTSTKLWKKFRVLSVEQQVLKVQRSIHIFPKRMPSLRIMIPKANSKELRPLSVPRLEVRIIFGILNLIISITQESWISSNQFGFVINRSIGDAWYRLVSTILDLYKKLAPRGTSDIRKYIGIYEYDIAKFFDCIDKGLIHETYRELWKTNKRAMRYLSMLDTMPCVYKRRLIHQEKGVPQGAATSPIIANAVLVQLELFSNVGLTGELLGYADDGLLISPLETLEKDIGTLRGRLRGGIEFKESKSFINSNGLIKFLGILLDLNTGTIRLDTRKNDVRILGTEGIVLNWCKQGLTSSRKVVREYFRDNFMNPFFIAISKEDKDKDKRKQTRIQRVYKGELLETLIIKLRTAK